MEKSSPKKVLVVEDEPDMLELNSLLVESLFRNVCITKASSIENAIRIIKDRNMFDLVLSDIEKREMDGVETLPELKRK